MTKRRSGATKSEMLRSRPYIEMDWSIEIVARYKNAVVAERRAELSQMDRIE